ncbi:MAG TPA: CHASE3 domain-containing protein [Candidatus Binatia bacterium]|nr:CHASE3 domain-containing protein [Candidatus Binatia bacterium]
MRATSRSTVSLPTAGFAAALLLVTGLGVLSYARLQSTLAAGDAARHTLQVLQVIEVVLGRLRDAETGQRGFVLTGEEPYLEPYRTSRQKLPRDLNRLRRLASDNPAQAVRMLQLEPLVAQKMVELDLTIALRRERGFESALEIVTKDTGREAMDAARGILADMATEERTLLREQAADREHDARQATAAGVGGSLLTILLLVGSALALRRQMERRAVAEHTTRESQERLLVTLSSIGDAVIATDTSGIITFMNLVAQTLTGWGQLEARGRPLPEVFRIVNETSRMTVENPVDKVLREGRIVGLANHTVLIGRDGTELPIDDSAAPIRDGDGEVMGVVLVFRDVSERKVAEESRERYVRAEAANQAKDDFLAVLSHELRAPLNAMLGWVRLLQRPERTAATIDRAIEVLERNIGTQTRVINELLDVSRIVSGRLQLELEPLNLVDIVRDAVDSIRVAAEGRGLVLMQTLPEQAVLPVRGDPARLQQVMGNLLTNAVKFTPAGGRIDVMLTREVDGARIVVRDTGQGIAPEFLPYVFERFRQADSSTSRAHGGLGLGLAIARSLVERHDGTLTASSEGTGHGATFTVALPLVSELPSLPIAAPARVDGGTTLADVSVLVVEDDADTLEALRLALEASGARVLTATSMTAALAAWEAAKPHVVVSDISMPGGDGYDLIRAIRERDGGHTPAVAMTGLVSKEDRSAALAAGFDAHLSKPIDPDYLVRFLTTLAARTPLLH